MILRDVEIYRWAQNGLIQPYFAHRVSGVGYDLTVEFFPEMAGVEMVELAPGKSVMAGCRELLYLPNNMCAFVVPRNTAIRYGVNIIAPVYQPGHCTRIFFRAVNTGLEPVVVSKGHSLAMLMLYKLSGDVKEPYTGKYQNEFKYREPMKRK